MRFNLHLHEEEDEDPLGSSFILPGYERFEWYCMADPGTAISPFAVLFIALDRWSPFIYLLDEIYETDPEKTTAGSIVPRIKQKCVNLTGSTSNWKFYYDVAAAWFKQAAKAPPNNLLFSPVEKRAGDKEDGIDIIQEMFIQNLIGISSNCPNTIWELDNYFKDKKGNFIKKNDNQIDNLRYFTKMSRIIIESQDAPRDPTKRRKARSRDYSVDGLREKSKKNNWSKRILDRYS